MLINTFELGPLNTNCHIISNGGYALAVDPGGDPKKILEFLRANSLTLLAIYITHFHFDHIYGAAALGAETRAPIFGPQGDAHFLKSEIGGGGLWGLPKVPSFDFKPLEEGEHNNGPFSFKVLHTPGHTPGSMSLYFPDAGAIFTGDVIFYRSIGRTDFEDGSQDDLMASIKEKIFTLPGDTKIYPGHGMETTVEDEKRGNPHCGDFR